MFSGEPINTSEGRAVLHTALRNLEGSPIYVDEIDVMPSVIQTLEKMKDFSERLRSGYFLGQGGAIRATHLQFAVISFVKFIKIIGLKYHVIKF